MNLGLGSSLKTAGNVSTSSIITDGLVLKSNFDTGKVTPISDGSASFDGTDDYITMGNACNLGTGDFTIAGWMNATDYTNNQSFVSKYQDSNNRWYFGTDASDRPIFYSKTGGSATIGLTGTDVVTDNTWHHFAISCDRDGTENLYIDGALNVSASCAATDIDNTGDLHIGRYSTTYHDGNICNVGIWSAALTAAQIKSIMYKNYSGLTSSETTNLVSWWNLSADANDNHGSNNGTLS